VSYRTALPALAVVALAGLALAACSSGPDHVAYKVAAPTGTVAPGQSQQFDVTDSSAAVTWGVAESGEPTPAASSASSFPAAVSSDGRYLVDQDGKPWRVQADAAWLMSSEATPEEVDQYLTTRSAQGFNSFYLMAMVHPGGYERAHHAPNNRNGDPPFATPGDFSTAGASPESEQYWQWIDTIVDKAAQHHMVVMMAYSYLGWNGGDMGWYQDILKQPTRDSLVDWGKWIGNRYKDKPNIIWFGFGDFAPPPGEEGALRTRAIADGIKASGAKQLFMAEPSPPDQLPSESPEFAPVLDMNSFYGYGPEGLGAVYETADRSWRMSPPMPAWMEEGTYEYENNWGHFSGKPWDTRRGRFWSVLAGGIAGDGFGSKDVWQWTDIPKSLSTPGADYSTYAFNLLASMPWWELQPSGTDPGFAGVNLVPSGQGTWGKLDYITAAVTADHNWLLAYVPVTETGTRTFSVDMSALGGPARARWFDPATGNYLTITDSPTLPNSGTPEFTTPGQRDDGTDDWVLVLDTAGPSPCGTITSSGLYTAPTSVPEGVTCSVTATLQSDPSVVVKTPVDVTPS
jgi:hypothetical protein